MKQKTYTTKLIGCVRFLLVSADIVCSKILDLYSDIKRTDLYKREIKKAMNELMEAKAIHERDISHVLRSLDLEYTLAYVCQFIEDEMELDFLKFLSAIKMQVGKVAGKHSDIIAQVVLVRSISEQLNYIEQNMESEARKEGTTLKTISIERIAKSAQKLSYAVTHTIHIDDTIRANDDTQHGLEIIFKKLTSSDLHERAEKYIENESKNQTMVEAH